MITGMDSKKRLVPFAAVFAALYGTLRLIPISAWIGVPGRVFTASEFFGPLLGTMLGPYAGSVAAIVGTFLGIVLTGRMNFFGLDFLPIVANALVLGFLMRGKWFLSALLYSSLLILFFIDPATLHFVSVPLSAGRIDIPYIWLHIIAWLLLLSPLGRKSQEWIRSRSMSRMTAAAILMTLVGTTAQQLAGNLLVASMATPLMGISPEALLVIWATTFWVYPVERLIIVIGATVVTIAAVKALEAIGPAPLVGATPRPTIAGT